jgi:hypothetical protein
MYFLKKRTTAYMKTTVLNRLSKTILTRILPESSSLRRKYSETMSKRRINMNTVNFFINKKERLRDPAAVPLAINVSGYNTGWFFIENVGCDLGEVLFSL